MAFVGSLSGSVGTIAVTGSLVPGTNNTYDIGASSSAWKSFYVQNISGSIKTTSGGDNFIKAGPNITANYNALGQWEITGSGGGGGSSVFTEASATAAYTTSSIAIGQASAASSIGSNLFFYVSGSKTSGGRPTSGVASFGGDLVVTGTIYLGDGSVSGIYNRDGVALLYSTSPTSVVLGQDVILNTNVIKANDAQTAITLTSANVAVAGDLTVTGNDISGSSGLNLTLGASGAVTTAGNLTVTGNQISGSAGGNILLGSSGDVTVAGDLAVTGGDLTTTAATATLFNANATTVTIAGGATSGTTVGNATGGVTLNGTATVTGDLAVNGATSADITTTTATATLFGANATNVTLAGAATTLSLGSSSGTSTVNNNLVVKGDLYISGTTTTIDSTVVEMQDPVIGLGFSSGSVAIAAGDRGFIGGITGAGNNVALVWSNNSGSFVATRTTTAPGSAPVVISTLLPVRAARLDVNGTAAYVTSSDGQTLELNGASGKGVKFMIGSSTPFAQFIDNGANAEFGAISNKQLNISGSQVNLNAGTNGFYLQKNGTAFAQITGNTATLAITPQAGILTASIVNSVSELINFGGAATIINVGNSAGVVNFSGNINANGNTTLGNATSDRVTFNAYVTSSILPSDDLAFNLGAPSQRWMNIYTGDLHLRNDRGDYTLIEEEEFLSIRFNKTGKRYKFLLEAVPELDEK